MAAVEPSTPFRAFEAEVNTFRIHAHEMEGGGFRFEAKQRLIVRAEGFAIREAYQRIHWWRVLFMVGLLDRFMGGMAACETRLVVAENDPLDAADPVEAFADRGSERHRAEILLNLYARTIQQFTQRRLYTVAAVAAVAAAVASVAALAVAVVNVCRLT